jgi:ATP-dependent Clp protease ATP-binding subunit ClpX
MTQPKNALVRQYKAMFEIEGCQLEFTDDALRAFAEQAMLRETGVRALRSMFEQVLLDLRFDIGARKGERIVVTRDFVQERLSSQRTHEIDDRKRDSA